MMLHNAASIKILNLWVWTEFGGIDLIIKMELNWFLQVQFSDISLHKVNTSVTFFSLVTSGEISVFCHINILLPARKNSKAIACERRFRVEFSMEYFSFLFECQRIHTLAHPQSINSFVFKIILLSVVGSFRIIFHHSFRWILLPALYLQSINAIWIGLCLGFVMMLTFIKLNCLKSIWIKHPNLLPPASKNVGLLVSLHPLSIHMSALMQ